VQVVSEGCREAYVQRVARRTVRVMYRRSWYLGLDDLLLLGGLRGGLALLGPERADARVHLEVLQRVHERGHAGRISARTASRDCMRRRLGARGGCYEMFYVLTLVMNEDD
jgi:predicted ThiF/HesA family dinucleotide-utilizing enzyme